MTLFLIYYSNFLRRSWYHIVKCRSKALGADAISTDQKLTPELLRLAYCNGYFPMPDPQTQEILWYRPDPRAVIPLDGFITSRSLQRSIRNRGYRCTIDEDFAGVMQGCGDRHDTWINAEFLRAYQELNSLGDAHSVEVWHGDNLVGGVYGVKFGGAFFAESKFHKQRDASKVALAFLIQHLNNIGMRLLEVQFLTKHLATLGATEISAGQYQKLLGAALKVNPNF